MVFPSLRRAKEFTLQGKECKAVLIIGPTASGKTGLAHRIADELAESRAQSCVLVNLDAFQFYRGVDVGVAKPTAQEIIRYNYLGIDFLEPNESMDAARFADNVWQSCREISASGGLPVCVGGSGLYLRAFLHGLDQLPPRNDRIRSMLRVSADAWGWPTLHGWLAALSPARAAQLHPNDGTRIERALEIFLQLPEGQSAEHLFSRTAPLREQEMRGNCYVIRVDCDDQVLRYRIEKRLDTMFEHGWIEEVQSLKDRWGDGFLLSQAGRAIGYKTISDALENCSRNQGTPSRGDDSERHGLTPEVLQDVKKQIATLTWQYVRRQRTWNAKERCDWAVESPDEIVRIQFPASFLSFLDGY